ncbi:Zinc finger CCCH domain-containing protein [Rhynchospora pubera]|uniref:Zinc finger CCCH domain-containing protein n=1 Tax=Rhynchospora pubera TaxID=906938 RepID=A0AAV8DVI4_9POAL|nr:Zinc finger CCCH domain-containing protein [Rhynchospora pubera]
MDAYEATRVVFSRIQALDPDNASKIMGLLLIQDHGEKEMIRLALGPESLLQSLILKSRKDLNLSSPPPPPPSFNTSPRLLPSPTSWASSPQPFSRSNNGSLEEPTPCAEDIYGEVLEEQGLGFYPEAMAGWGGLGWKPCLYFARGYCKNGASCRFLHDEKLDAATAAAVSLEQEILLRSKSQSPRPSQLMASAFPYSPTSKGGVGFLLQQQTESQRAAAVAAALMASSGADDAGRFIARSPRLERSDLAAGLNNPGARQIYLTFPADSTFSEEDVSNYFSIYGPVQDVRIPYQQKRMFGFVTFIYPETVKLILAKGNPHFVCDARVLVKPYKEKGKVPEKYRSKNLQAERGDFSGCSTPTGLLDTRDPFELPHLGARMLYGSSPTQEAAYLRRKLEEQQQQLEFQQAIELQGRRFMGLQLLDLKNRTLNSPTITPPSPIAEPKSNLEEDATNQDKKACSNNQSAAAGVTETGDPPKVNGPQGEVVKESGTEAATTNAFCGFPESGPEHNLPDSPFASPTKSYSQIVDTPFLSNEPSSRSNSNSTPFMASPLLPPSSIDLASYNSCFFQMPRFSSGHGAIGMRGKADGVMMTQYWKTGSKKVFNK